MDNVDSSSRLPNHPNSCGDYSSLVRHVITSEDRVLSLLLRKRCSFSTKQGILQGERRKERMENIGYSSKKIIGIVIALSLTIMLLSSAVVVLPHTAAAKPGSLPTLNSKLCKSFGGTWTPGKTPTCTITTSPYDSSQNFSISAKTTFVIASGASFYTATNVSIINYGTIDLKPGSTAQGTMDTILQSFGVLTNYGKINVENPLTEFRLNYGTFTNYGAVNNSGAFDNELNSTAINYGTVTNNYFSNSVFRNYGTFTNTATGTINSSTIFSNYGTFSNVGTIYSAYDFYNAAGTFYNSGTIYSSDFFTNSGAFSNSGTLYSTNRFNNFGTFSNAGTINTTSTFVNNNGKAISNSGTIFIGASSFVQNYGSVTNNASGTIANKGFIENDGTFANNGTFYNYNSISNIAGYNFINAATLSNNGTFSNSGTLTNTGTFDDTSGSVTNIGTITNSGTWIPTPDLNCTDYLSGVGCP